MSLIVDGLRTASPASRGSPRAAAFARARTRFAADRTILAIIGTVVGSLLIAVSDVFSKVLTKTLPAIEVTWLRYAVFSILVVPLMRRGVRDAFRTASPRVQMTRGIASGLATALAITGFAFLPVAEAPAIGFVAPVFVSALAVLVLREQVGVAAGRRRSSASPA